MAQQSHLWFLNNINLQHVFPPIINDANVILNRCKFDCKKKNMNARVICNINVKEEAIRLNVNDDNVILKVREIVWRSSSPLDKQMYFLGENKTGNDLSMLPWDLGAA
ncbi:8616_t:CDS:2, partial [Acaulospora morrowiae]